VENMPRSKTKTSSGYETPFATRLRGLIDEAGIPQSALAEHIGVTRQAISTYSLGTSVPDIDKFEGIANFFEVSTEYLLGRTDIKKADTSKQATAEYLGLSEGAIDAIRSLQLGQIEQAPLRDYKPELVNYPMTQVFNAWLESVDLSKLTSDMYKLLLATCEYNTSGLNPDKHKMNDEQKQAVMLLQQSDYIVLSMREQLDYYNQIVLSEFRKSVEELAVQARKMAMHDDRNNGE